MKKESNRHTLSWIMAVAGKRQVNIVLLIVCQVVIGATGVGYALLLRELIDAAVAGSKEQFIKFALLFGGLVLLQISIRAVIRYLEERSRSKLENCFKRHLFSTLLAGDYAAVSATHSGEWMNRLTSDTKVIAEGMTEILPGLIGMLVSLVCAVVVLLGIEPRFAIIIIPGGIALILLSYAFRKVLKKLHKQQQEADGRLRVFLQEHLSSMLIVRSFAQESNVESGADALMDGHRAARMKRSNFHNFCNIGFALLMRGAYVFGAIYGGVGILKGTISYGTFTAILQLVGQVQSPFSNISGYLPRYYSMLASAERIMEADEMAEAVSKNVHSHAEVEELYRHGFEAIAMNGVCFTYEPPKKSKDGETVTMPIVLSDLDITIRKGEYAAFVGPSGCGKSTALKLLMGIYRPDSGSCSIQTDGGEMPLDPSWRGLFAYVPQGNQLLSGSIRQILCFNDAEQLNESERMWRALEAACADDFVSALEQGLDTELGERGAGLSEGQMQRIAIARAIFSDHPILLLDEATSSLDEATEARLLGKLREMTDKTVIIVTHRRAALSITDKTIDFSK